MNQDHKLAEVHKDVQELTGIAISIRDGLDEDTECVPRFNPLLYNHSTYVARILANLDHETEETDGQMKKAVRQVEELIEKAGEGWSWGIIGFLVVLLVVLIVVVFEM